MTKYLNGFGQIKIILIVVISIFCGIISGILAINISMKAGHSEILQALLGVITSNIIAEIVLFYFFHELYIKAVKRENKRWESTTDVIV